MHHSLNNSSQWDKNAAHETFQHSLQSIAVRLQCTWFLYGSDPISHLNCSTTRHNNCIHLLLLPPPQRLVHCIDRRRGHHCKGVFDTSTRPPPRYIWGEHMCVWRERWVCRERRSRALVVISVLLFDYRMDACMKMMGQTSTLSSVCSSINAWSRVNY